MQMKTRYDKLNEKKKKDEFSQYLDVAMSLFSASQPALDFNTNIISANFNSVNCSRWIIIFILRFTA